MKHLLTFIGDNDCRLPKEKGAVLGLLENGEFGRVTLLYSREKYLDGIRAIREYLQYRGVVAGEMAGVPEVYELAAGVDDPTNHATVYPAMYADVREVVERWPEDEFTVSVTSGTPTMHACWIFLVKGGVLPARMVQIARDGRIRDIDLELDDFPEIRRVDSVKAQNTWLSRENRQLRAKLLSGAEGVGAAADVSLLEDNMLGESAGLLRAKRDMGRIAGTDIPVFINGESGTGKELAAQIIHRNSSRRAHALVAVNCGAIPEQLFESEFFGHRKGAFTGAIKDRAGKFMEAHRGTLFLDEVAELPAAMQVKLLRVLQEGSFEALGDDKTVNVDVRIISASNKDLREEVRAGRFRQDLFYRLLQFELYLPPLRERGRDVLMIARAVIRGLNEQHGIERRLNADAEEKLMMQTWPGNVRQLISSLQVAWRLAGEEIFPEDIRIVDVHAAGVDYDFPFPPEGIDLKEEVMPAYYRLAMHRAGGNGERAGELLGMTGAAFRAQWRKLKET